MPPDRGCFTPVNLPPSFTLPECMDYFTLAAGPNTDLWRKPPDRDTATAPILYTSLRQPFAVAEVTVSADWEMEWDQGGLVIFAGAPPRTHRASRESSSNTNGNGRTNRNDHHNNTTNNHHNEPHSGTISRGVTRTSQPPPYPHSLPTTGTKWVKAGLEFSAGTVNAASVSATADGADWCLSPLAPPHTPTTSPASSGNSLRIKLERIGHSLWVWYQIPSALGYGHTRTADEISSSWRKLREVTWFFWGVEDKSVHVGVYASRPANFSVADTVWAQREGMRFVGSDANLNSSKLVVEFEDLEIF
ncbi:hypothetical protein VTO42DRAFT_3111 [Malbranchea cinnamomea]